MLWNHTLLSTAESVLHSPEEADPEAGNFKEEKREHGEYTDLSANPPLAFPLLSVPSPITCTGLVPAGEKESQEGEGDRYLSLKTVKQEGTI